MYFNCWSLCQRVHFSDKKQNMCMRIRLTGTDVECVTIIKNINVQQNPGRGAKVVTPRAPVVPYRRQSTFRSDGSSGGSVVKLRVKFCLGMFRLETLFNIMLTCQIILLCSYLVTSL